MKASSLDVKPTSPEQLSALRGHGVSLAAPVLIMLVLAVAAVFTEGFFSTDNARAILLSASVVGVVAVGMTPITLSGNLISLSAQQMTVLTTMLYLTLSRDGSHWAVGLLAVTVVVVLIGVVQGFIVAAGVNPIITTLAAGAIIFGVLAAYTGGRAVSSSNPLLRFIAEDSLFGMPVAVHAFLLFTGITHLYITRTVAGRQTLLVGASRGAAANSGVSVYAVVVGAFVIFAIGAVLAGVLTAGQLGQASATDLGGLTFDVIAAILVGGTAIQGGEGSPLRSAIGAVMIACFNNIMILNGWSVGYRLTVTGLLVAAVVLVLHAARKGARR